MSPGWGDCGHCDGPCWAVTGSFSFSSSGSISCAPGDAEHDGGHAARTEPSHKCDGRERTSRHTGRPPSCPTNRRPALSDGALIRGPRLLAMERECQTGNDEGQEKDRQDALSAASEGDDLTLGGVEGLGPAGVSAVADLQGVTSGFDRYVDGLVQFHGSGRLAVDHSACRKSRAFLSTAP